ncbi:MAG: hypothetical protein LBB72_00150 [Spirochaetaceae bacterium]|jgi:hypothetical protein|nr:hypothetical protein [Spirochaetaceae bacterium]
MKKIFLACLFIGIVVLQVPAQKTQGLTWDIQFQKGKERVPVPNSQTITVESGQDFFIVISPASDCFCYVLSQNSERNIFLLHDQPVKGEMKIRLDPLKTDASPGTKTVYVIMSLAKQTKLEGFIKSYKSDLNSQRHANNLQGEIARLQEAASGLGEPASALIASGGTTRGENQESATRFSGKNIYVRTITIRTAPAVR